LATAGLLDRDVQWGNGVGSWYDAVSPEVSIIILNFNKSDLTRECLRHIWANTNGKRYEIIVVDNGSTAADFTQLSQFVGDFHLLRLPVNRYFGEGNNIGVEASRGRYVVFLNNDAFVAENWLSPLIGALEKQPHAGGAGAKFLYPDGRMQEAGAFIDERGQAIQRGKFYPLERSDADTIAVVDYCSAACFATSRAIFDRVAGFDPVFEPAYYEDADLALKIASLGLFIYYCPQSVVYHVENGTAATWGKSLGFDSIVEINRHKFLARWGNYLSARAVNADAAMPTLPASRLRSPVDARAKDPVAVFYTPYDLVPGGGERYLLTAASASRKTHRVYVATRMPYSQFRLDYLARELSLDLSQITMVTHADLPRLGPIDVFVHMGNIALPEVPAAGRRNFYICQFPFPMDDLFATNYWENLRTYKSILVYSEFARRVVCGRINPVQFSADIKILCPPVPVAVAARRKETAGPPLILSIGRFFTGGHNKRHDVMIDGVRQLKDAGIEVELHLVGTLHSHPDHMRHYGDLHRRAEGLPVHFHANASPDVLSDLLARATFYWHATGYDIDENLTPEKCEHFGISVVEAMATGSIPFVVSNGGPAEIVREHDTGFHYTTLDELVAKTKSIIGDTAGIAAMRERAIADAQQYAEAIFAERWLEIANA
jgi:O-antigen biosynthesis protein